MEQRQPWKMSNVVRQQHADQSNMEQHLREARMMEKEHPRNMIKVEMLSLESQKRGI
jgi:hypothetical protein